MLLWRYRPNPFPRGPLALGLDGAVYTTSGGYVRVLDPNGALRTVVKPGRKYVAGVVADAQGRIYASGDNGTISAYSRGGSLLWTVLSDGDSATPLLISADGQTLYAGTSKEQLDAYATSDGQKLWGAPLGGILGTPALGGDGTIVIGSSDGTLHAIAPDGSTRWRYPAGAWVQTTPAFSGNTVYGATDSGIVFALNADGTQRWRSEMAMEIIGLATSPDGTTYVSGATDILYALASDGTQRWALPLHGDRPTAPTTGADGRIYVGAEDGRINVISPDGQLSGSLSLRAPITIAPLIGRDGAIYVAVGDKQESLVAFGTQALKELYNAQ